MNDLDVQTSLSALRRQSQVSLVLVLLGAAFLLFSVYYSASRLTPLENEIASKRLELAKLQQEEEAYKVRIAELQASYSRLRANAESLYSVKVTPSNQVYEVKATAKATGRTLSHGRPEYKFTLLINSPPATLADIAKVTYRLEHETFRQKDYVATDAASQFSTGYVGWGCLTSVKVSVLLKSGVTQDFDFNMCRSLGPQWQ